jgi:hypothetical protein
VRALIPVSSDLRRYFMIRVTCGLAAIGAATLLFSGTEARAHGFAGRPLLSW